MTAIIGLGVALATAWAAARRRIAQMKTRLITAIGAAAATALVVAPGQRYEGTVPKTPRDPVGILTA